MKDKNKLTKFNKKKDDIIVIIIMITVFLLPGIIIYTISKKFVFSIIVTILFWLVATLMAY